MPLNTLRKLILKLKTNDDRHVYLYHIMLLYAI